jgi:integrase
MRDASLEVTTINQRLSKIKAIYKIATAKHVLDSNPTVDTVGFKESSAQKRRKRRLPFDQRDLELLFGSEVYVRHTRSKGQSGEASYWIPLLMFYTGARPEEIAGLALSDLSEHPTLGCCLNIIDRPSAEDIELFDGIPESHRRTLKNAMSQRTVPVAQELIDLGLLRYVDWVRARGATVFFPGLKKNWHEKLSGSFSKFFGRYLRAIGIADSRKVLYSFRHSLKDLMEIAEVPSKYLQRLLGHTTGDGAVTDGYGSDLPFERVAEHFARIRFPAIPATPWQPGRGFVRLKAED